MCKNDIKVTKALQNKELEMLIELSDLLKQSEIPFFLAYGTAIGCVRHEGFIPWDDDIDIHIWAKDYEKLKKVFQNGRVGNLLLHDFDTVRDYPYTFPKIVSADSILVEESLQDKNYMCGVYIDIFPLQYLNDNKIIRFFQESIRYFRYTIIRLYYNEQYTWTRKKLAKLIRLFFNPFKIQKQLYETSLKNNNGKYLIDPLIFFDKHKIKKDYFTDSIDKYFEGVFMPLPIDYDGYLRNYYGDYMKLPSENERKSNHSFCKLEINGKKYI